MSFSPIPRTLGIFLPTNSGLWPHDSGTLPLVGFHVAKRHSERRKCPDQLRVETAVDEGAYTEEVIRSQVRKAVTTVTRHGRIESDDVARPTADDHLDLLIGLQNYLDKALAPYEEFTVGGKTYYLSPGGFLHRKDPGSEEEEGYFCGYLDDEVWHHINNHLK
jgi:hypothetical protein